MSRTITLLAVSAVLVGVGQVWAASVSTSSSEVTLTGTPIPGLYNTGEEESPEQVDLHYTLIVSPDATYNGPEAYRPASRSRFWLENTSTSKWISPGINGLTSFAAGEYVYRTTFDLTGFAPETAVIAGAWASDNETLDILINGASTGTTHRLNGAETFPGPFSESDLFLISGGFLPGENTLDFVLNNRAPSAQGLHVQLIGTAQPIPEPSTFVLLAMGTIGLLAYTRRRVSVFPFCGG